MNNKFFEFSNLPGDDKTELLTQLFKLYHVIVDREGIIYHVSDEFSKFVGYSKNYIISRNFSDFLPATEHTLFTNGTIEGTAPSTLKQTLLFADGSQKEIDLTTGNITISAEVFTVVSHFNVPGSDYSQDYRHLFEQSGVAELLLTPDELQIVAANHSAQVLSGLNETALKKMLLTDLVELSQQQLLAEFNKLHAETDLSFNLNLIVASGEPHFVQLKVNPVQLSGTTLLHLQIIKTSEQKELVEQLRQAEDLNDSLFDSLPTASLLMDSFGVISKISHELSAMLGKNTDELVGQRARSVLPEQLTKLISPMELSSNKVSLRINKHLVHADFVQQPIRDGNNQSLGLLLTIEPLKVTQLPLRLKALEAANEMAVYSIFVIDKQGEVIYVNEGFEHQSGYKVSNIIGRNISILNDPSSDPFIFNNMWDVINKKQIWRGTLKNLKYSGSSYWVDVTVKPMMDDLGDVECFVGVSVDVTQQRELHKAGVYIANYDLATGLANEILAKDRLEGMLSRAQRRKLTVAVIYLDISKVSSFSKELGPAKSNEILSLYCEMMRSALRNEDALVRMSQNRLAILLPDLPDVTALEVVVAKIDKVNSQPVVISDEQFDLDIRQGIAYYPEQGADADSLFLNAESSLQRAWHSNERIGSFGEQLNDQAVMHFNLRRDIVAALQNEELEILYQPIIDLVTNSVISVEAMLQWHHKRHGIIRGDDIYAVAEASGIMAELGLWLFEKACVDLVHWREQGHLNLTLAINLSHGQLRDRNIAQTIANILNCYKLPANIISLELPLSYIATQWLDLDAILEELSLLGISLQYDRFGERGAYISDLRHFPFSGLKISSEYVSQLDEDLNAASLVQGIISMAQALDLKVTAIGVRQLSQMLQLQEMGCHYVQGDFTRHFSSRDEIDTFLIQQEGCKQLSWE